MKTWSFTTMKKNIFLSILTILVALTMQSASFAENIKFIQVTDAHFKTGSPYREAVLKETIKDINNQKDIAFVVFTGDNIDSPHVEYLQEFMHIIKGLKLPYYIVIGNHDVFKNGGLSKAKYIETIREYNFHYRPRKPNYVFKKNGFVFIVVDGAKEVIPGSMGYYRQDTLAWLEKNLIKNQNSPVVIFQHYPLVEPKDLKSHMTYQKEEYLKMLDKHQNVVAVLSGHFHINGENMRNGVYHISTPTLLNEPNSYKIIDITTTKGFSPMIYTELKEIKSVGIEK